MKRLAPDEMRGWEIQYEDEASSLLKLVIRNAGQARETILKIKRIINHVLDCAKERTWHGASGSV